jgi:hypothetical protein
MTEQRKFASALRPGMAAQLRESVSEVVRQTTSLVSRHYLRLKVMNSPAPKNNEPMCGHQ